MGFKRSIEGADVAIALHSRFNISNTGNTVLEFGFGDGNYVAQFLEDGYNVIAVDSNKAKCENIIQLLNDANISTDKLTVLRHRIENFEFPPETYAAIVCQNVLHFLKKEIALFVIDKMINSLLPGGFLYLVVHHKEHPSNGRMDTGFKSFYDELELESMFAERATIYFKCKAWKPEMDESIGLTYLLRKLTMK